MIGVLTGMFTSSVKCLLVSKRCHAVFRRQSCPQHLSRLRHCCLPVRALSLTVSCHSPTCLLSPITRNSRQSCCLVLCYNHHLVLRYLAMNLCQVRTLPVLLRLMPCN